MKLGIKTVLIFQTMSSFPPANWAVRFLKDMPSLACEAADNVRPSMAAYMVIKPAGGEEGNFRFVMAGPHKIRLRFEVTKVIPSSLFEGMIAEAELDIGDQVRLERNSVCSAWMDVLELVRSQDFMVTDEADNDVAENFLTGMQQHREDLVKAGESAEGAGICVRWLLGTRGEDKDIVLMAQVKIIP